MESHPIKLMKKARISPTIRFTLFIGAVCFASVAAIRADENIMIQEDNMKELKCSLPNDRFRLVESNSPGQLFLSDEPVDLKLAFKKGDLNGNVAFSMEIQEVGTRTPGKVAGGMTGWTDTSGKAPLFDLIGAPVKHDFTVDFGGGRRDSGRAQESSCAQTLRYLRLDPLPWQRAPVPWHGGPRARSAG